MIAITYIGHATTLIESDGMAVLTDPNFSNRVLFVRRSKPLNYDPVNLPELSAVVISHAHMDHLNIESFKYIKSSVPIFVPVGLGKFISKFVRNPVIELEHWASHKLPNGLEVTATEAKHRGFRWFGFRYSKCNGYVISFPNVQDLKLNAERVFFAGDSGYGPHFKEIGNLYNGIPISAALLPIGAYAPSWFMKSRHLNPPEALEAFLDVGAKHFIPIHHGVFKISSESSNEPAEWLTRVAGERNLSDRVHILNPGEKYSV